MSPPQDSRAERAAPADARWQGVVNWLALLMLLAGSVVWPH